MWLAAVTSIACVCFVSAEIEKYVSQLVELLPNWLTVLEVRGRRFLKIDRTTAIKDVQEQLLKHLNNV